MRRRRKVSRVRIYSDPFQHALIAAAVVAPLVSRAGPRVLRTAVVSSLVIDLDHAVAARSLRLQANISLPTRPRSHNLLTALGVGGLVTAAAGAAHGWSAFAGLTSHLLHDAGDDAAPTPMLWPFASARQIGRRRQIALTPLLFLGSIAVSRATAGTSTRPSSAGAGGDGAAALPRTA